MNISGTSSSMLRRQRDATEPQQHPRDGTSERDVNRCQRRVAHGDASRVRDGFARSHHAVDDPRLTAELRRHPPRDQRDERERPRRDHTNVEPA